MMLEWKMADRELKPEDATDSDEEGDESEQAEQHAEKREEGETDDERDARMAALREQTQRHIREHKAKLSADGVRLCWVVYHDGGYTAAADTKDSAVDKAGWGLRAQLFNLTEDATEVLDTIVAYGPVQLDPDVDSYIGCLKKSNNTAELTAVPHAMTLLMKWKRGVGRTRWGMRSTGTLGVIMVYDSQYTKDVCTAPEHVPVPCNNRTAIVVCRRLIEAARDRRVQISWVKVKGHSKEEGNDSADKLAGYAQNGGEKNVQDIAMMMDLLRSEG